MPTEPVGDDIRNATVPRSMATSRIWARGGYAVISGMIGRDLLEALKAEAEDARPSGQRMVLPISSRTEHRGGSPARAVRSAPCAAVHRALHASTELVDAIGEMCGFAVTSTGIGTYHFYEREGDFFGLHRDFVGCDIAAITCLSERLAERPVGGLLVYPNLFCQGLSEVRATGNTSSVPIPLRPGETAILLGGQLPHEVTPVVAGQDRVVAVNCYRLSKI